MSKLRKERLGRQLSKCLLYSLPALWCAFRLSDSRAQDFNPLPPSALFSVLPVTCSCLSSELQGDLPRKISLSPTCVVWKCPSAAGGGAVVRPDLCSWNTLWHHRGCSPGLPLGCLEVSLGEGCPADALTPLPAPPRPFPKKD